MVEDVIVNEIIHKGDKEKTIFHFIDTANNIETISREKYKKKDLEIHYPFYIDKRTKQPKPKYKKIKAILFIGFKDKIPAGFIKSYEGKFGFTRSLKPLSRFIDSSNLDIESLTLTKSEKTNIENKSLILNYKDFESIRKYIGIEFRKCNDSNKIAINNFLSKLLPLAFEIKKKKYTKGFISNLLKDYEDLIQNLSVEDRDSLLQLFEKLSLLKKDIFEKRIELRTKTKINQIYIENVLNKFERLLSLKRVGEEKWQEFFKENGWIFSQLFAYPTVLLKERVFVGGTTIGEPGKIVDFLYTNKLTDNIALIEIKTHKTRLLGKKAYRGKDVFALDRELSGGINQVLDQRDNLYREANSRFKNSKNDIFNSKCLLVIGLISDLTNDQRKCFELYRHSCKDVEIITFDELHDKIKSVLNIFKSQEDETTK